MDLLPKYLVYRVGNRRAEQTRDWTDRQVCSTYHCDSAYLVAEALSLHTGLVYRVDHFDGTKTATVATYRSGRKLY